MSTTLALTVPSLLAFIAWLVQRHLGERDAVKERERVQAADRENELRAETLTYLNDAFADLCTLSPRIELERLHGETAAVPFDYRIRVSQALSFAQVWGNEEIQSAVATFTQTIADEGGIEVGPVLIAVQRYLRSAHGLPPASDEICVLTFPGKTS